MDSPSRQEVQELVGEDLGIEEDQLYKASIASSSLEDSESVVSDNIQFLRSDNTSSTPRGLENLRDLFAFL